MSGYGSLVGYEPLDMGQRKLGESVFIETDDGMKRGHIVDLEHVGNGYGTFAHCDIGGPEGERIEYTCSVYQKIRK